MFPKWHTGMFYCGWHIEAEYTIGRVMLFEVEATQHGIIKLNIDRTFRPLQIFIQL